MIENFGCGSEIIRHLNCLAKKVLELSKNQKLTYEQLAFEAGVPNKQISWIKRIKVNSSVIKILAITTVLDVPVKELFNF